MNYPIINLNNVSLAECDRTNTFSIIDLYVCTFQVPWTAWSPTCQERCLPNTAGAESSTTGPGSRLYTGTEHDQRNIYLN